jgi:hypothetical protein
VRCPCGYEFTIGADDDDDEGIGLADETKAERAARQRNVGKPPAAPAKVKTDEDESDPREEPSWLWRWLADPLVIDASPSAMSFPVLCPNCGATANLRIKAKTIRVERPLAPYTAQNPGKFWRTTYDSYLCEIYCCEACRLQVPAWERKRRLAAWLPRISLAAGVLTFVAGMAAYVAVVGGGIGGVPTNYFLVFVGAGMAAAVGVFLAGYQLTRSKFRFVEIRTVSATGMIGFGMSHGHISIRFPNRKYMMAYKAHYRRVRRAKRGQV